MLRDYGYEAKNGYNLSPDGPQFFHRTMGNNYLIRKQSEGFMVYGEASLIKGDSPLDMRYLKQKYSKVPDGIVLYSEQQGGTKKGFYMTDWVEVESAYKPYSDVSKALRLLSENPTLTPDAACQIHKIVFVYDSRQNHERRLVSYLLRFLRDSGGLSLSVTLDSIEFARCTVTPPLSWKSYEQFSAIDMLKQYGKWPLNTAAYEELSELF